MGIRETSISQENIMADVEDSTATENTGEQTPTSPDESQGAGNQTAQTDDKGQGEGTDQDGEDKSAEGTRDFEKAAYKYRKDAQEQRVRADKAEKRLQAVSGSAPSDEDSSGDEGEDDTDYGEEARGMMKETLGQVLDEKLGPIQSQLAGAEKRDFDNAVREVGRMPLAGEFSQEITNQAKSILATNKTLTPANALREAAESVLNIAERAAKRGHDAGKSAANDSDTIKRSMGTPQSPSSRETGKSGNILDHVGSMSHEEFQKNEADIDQAIKDRAGLR
jgi:hypothetical protein